MKNHFTKVNFIAWRFRLILAVITIAVLGLAFRLFSLTILDQSFLRKQGDSRVLRQVNTPAFRGMIVDRNGVPLAVSTVVYSAWMNPQSFHPDTKTIALLAKELELKPEALTQQISRYQSSKREFVYLRRGLSPELAKYLKSLKIPGLFMQEDYKRYYPEGEVTAHVIGFTNVDDHGQEGLELGYDQWLKGEPGKKWVIKDRLGRAIADLQTVQDQKPGHDLVLSIDRRIQYLAYKELLAGVTANEVRSASAVVLDTKTGEILAMVNVPSYNPNNRPARMSEVFRNRAVTDTFEPGSTIKAFTVASALESGKFTRDSLIDTSPGWMRVGHNVVKDAKNNGVLNLTQVLQKSSNMGAAKIVLSIAPDQLWNVLHEVGFGEPTGIHFPGEQNSTLVKRSSWGAFTLATLSFGYGLSSTTLQLARAYAVLANAGVKLPLSLLKVDETPQGEQVMDAKVAKEMLILLESVVGKGGTAQGAKVPGYKIAGKSGTSRIVGAKGYEKHRYTSTFVGIAPVNQPRLVVAVVMHDPQGKAYYGGVIAGPVFERIMEGSLRILDVAPDD